MGQQLSQTDYDAAGFNAVYTRTATYANGRLTTDTTNTVRGTDTFITTNSYDYGIGAAYALGSVITTTSTNSKIENGATSALPNTLVTNDYVWFDGATLSTTQNDTDTGSGSNPLWTSTYNLNALGQLTSVSIADGKPRTVSFTNDELGQVIKRVETGTIAGQTGNPNELWFRFNGKQLGYSGNNSINDVTTAASIAERSAAAPATAGTFRNGATTGGAYSDFAQSYDPINSYTQGSAGGSYTVRAGDTLQGIAQGLYGDSNLWYKIAEANGLSSASALIEGQSLTLPAGVVRNRHNASTANPYNPAEAIGDVGPTTPQPPKNNRCGGFGVILLAVIAAAVVVIFAPQAIVALKEIGLSAGAAFAGGGALAAAAGSVVSQGVGVAAQIQDKFSWKAVGLAALGGAIGGGLNGFSAFGKGALGGLTGVANDVVRGALSSGVTQGIGVATKLQDGFSWAGVAAAGVSAGLGGVLGRTFAGSSLTQSFVGRAAVNGIGATASLIANAATRSAIEGSDFGDNITAAIPDVIGQIIGTALGDAVSGGGDGDSRHMTALEVKHRLQAKSRAAQALVDERKARIRFGQQVRQQAMEEWTASGIADPVSANGTSRAAATSPDQITDLSRPARYIGWSYQKHGNAIGYDAPNGDRVIVGMLRPKTPVQTGRPAAARIRDLPEPTGILGTLNGAWNSLLGVRLLTYVSREGNALVDQAADGWISTTNQYLPSGFALSHRFTAQVFRDVGHLGFGLLDTAAHPGDIVEGFARGFDDLLYWDAEMSALDRLGQANAWLRNSTAEQRVDAGAHATAVVITLAAPEARLGRASRLGRTGEVGVPAIRSANPLSPVLDFDAAGNQIFYRSMSRADYARLQRTGQLPATSETFISPSLAYASQYEGVLVRLTTRPGTMDQLTNIGVAANPGTARLFPNLPAAAKGWTRSNAMLKLEGNVVNTGLGRGEALRIFNQNIVRFDPM